MRLVSAVFDTESTHGIYARLHRVWEYSAKKHCPGAAVDTLQLKGSHTKDTQRYFFDANNIKLKAWRDYVQEHDDDIVLMDADTMVLKNLQAVFDGHSFACAFTVRPLKRLAPNGGVVYVRRGKKARDIISLWQQCDDKLHADRALHQQYRAKYAGMNQSSWGYMMEKHKPDGVTLLPCSQYNRVDWVGRSYKDVYVVHVKSSLRHACLNDRPVNAQRHGMREYVRLWRDMEAKCLSQG